MNWRTGCLTIAAQRGFKEAFLESFRVVQADDGCACGRVVRDRLPVLIEDVYADSEFAPYRDIAEAAGFRAVQSVPLVSTHGVFVGVLSTHFPEKHRPSEYDLHASVFLGHVLANAIIRQRSLAAAQAQLQTTQQQLVSTRAAVERTLQAIGQTRRRLWD